MIQNLVTVLTVPLIVWESVAEIRWRRAANSAERHPSFAAHHGSLHYVRH